MINCKRHLVSRDYILMFLSSYLLVCSTVSAQIVEIHQLDVGQGDAALVIIRQPASTFNFLIDSGPKGKGRDLIVPYHLRSLGIDTLNAIIATHYHADHIGELSEVLNSEVVLKCYDRGESYNSKTFDNYVSEAAARRTSLHPGDTILFIRSGNSRIALVCLASGGNILNYGYAGTDDENTKSIALLLTFVANADTFKFFTAGDILADQESLIAENNPSVHNLNVMKISHHGSRSSTSTDALKTFSPNAVLISCGNDNAYGHPDVETLEKLDSQQSIKFVYQTERGDNSARKSIIAGNIVLKVYPYGYYTIQTDHSIDTFHLNHKSTSLLESNSTDDHRVVCQGSIASLAGSPSTINTTFQDGTISITAAPPVYVQTVSVLNILGSPLRVFNPNNLIGSLSISDHFNAGAYFVSIKTAAGTFTNKILTTE